MTKTIQQLQTIANLQTCDATTDKGQIIFDFFCPECHLKHGVLSTHNISVPFQTVGFKCPVSKCRARYSFAIAPFKRNQRLSKVKISKISSYCNF